jgi:hypothetical protein
MDFFVAERLAFCLGILTGVGLTILVSLTTKLIFFMLKVRNVKFTLDCKDIFKKK